MHHSGDPMTDQPPPAGWYPAPHANNEQRYWDGTQWTEPTPAASAAPGDVVPNVGSDAAATAVVGGTEPSAVAVMDQPPKKKGLKWWVWLLIGLGALLLLIIVIGSINGGSRDDDSAPASQSQEDDEPAEEPVEDTTVEIPDMVGMTVADATAALAALSITLELPAEVGADWVVTEQSVPGGTRIEPGDPLSISAEPNWTLSQKNAVAQAESYLDFSGFSRAGLIDQLEYEGYSTEDSTFAADNAGADWNAEAAEKAASYLETSSFSREGLYDQLAYEEFTPEQIEFALASVGY